MDLNNKISKWLNSYLTTNNLKTFVIGVSGGIDSSLTSTLCAMTGQKTIVVNLPIKQNKLQYELSIKHIEWLKSKYSNVISIEIDLTDTFKTFELLFNEKNELSLANSRSRLRMMTLYHISSLNNGIVVGTGNKIEDFGIGFFTKYGDGGVDISPIADLTKSEVRELSKKLGIINEIITSKPTDGLWDDDRTDEDQIGATYEELEWVMNFKEKNCFFKIFTKLNDRQKHVLNIYTDLNKKNKHKMVNIPTYKK